MMKNIKALKLTTNNSYEAPPMMPLNLPVVTVEATDGKEVVMTTCKPLPPPGSVVMTAPRQGEVEGLNNWQATSGDINVDFIQKKSTKSSSCMSGGDTGDLRWSELRHHVQTRDAAAALQHLHPTGPEVLTANRQAEVEGLSHDHLSADNIGHLQPAGQLKTHYSYKQTNKQKADPDFGRLKWTERYSPPIHGSNPWSHGAILWQ